MVDMAYEDPVQFLQSVIAVNLSDMDLSDAFLVFRNCSYQNDPSNIGKPCFEEAYQFVGNKIIKLNSRSLTNNDKELYNFRGIRIDPSTSDKLILLNLYNTSSHTFSI